MRSRLMLLSLVVVMFSGVFGGTAQASGTRQVCPLVGSAVDPDFVQFLGPSTIPVGGTSVVKVFASEIEAAQNLVTLTVTARGSRTGGLALILGPIVTGHGNHDVTVAVALKGLVGVTWRLDWVATFDFGVHTCNSRTFQHTPFPVRVI